MTNKEFAEILLPGVEHTWEEYEKIYADRNLKEGAIVTRYAPSPTGLPHMGNLFQAFISKNFAENIKAFIPITNDSKNETIPLITYNFKNLCFFIIELTSCFSTTISPFGVLTATAYSFGPRIITPSITACPPMLVLNLFSLIFPPWALLLAL